MLPLLYAAGSKTAQKNLTLEFSRRALRQTCMGRVKTILIDPPYNTGNQDFVYNDRFVGPSDRYRQCGGGARMPR